MVQQTYTVTEFLTLTPPQKQRLRERDPGQYERLFYEAKKSFDPTPDPEAAKALFGDGDGDND